MQTGIRKVEFATGVTLEVYPDGTKKQTELNGECTTYYPDESNMEKFSECFPTRLSVGNRCVFLQLTPPGRKHSSFG